MKTKRKIDFEELIPEVVFDNFKLCVEEKAPFEWLNDSKKVVIAVSGEDFSGEDNFEEYFKVWNNSYYISIDGTFIKSNHSFGMPMSIDDFLKLSYAEFINIFKRFFASELNNED